MQHAATLSGPAGPNLEDAPPRHWPDKQWGLMVWALLLLGVNLPLLRGHVNSRLLFQLEAATRGQWWRWFTFPLVHLSWYHLVLDGGAFLLLYHGLRDQGGIKRAMILGLSSSGSLLMGLYLGHVATNGLSGLSGIAHGLMAFSALEMTRDASRRAWGLVSLAMVTTKSLYELASGQVVFAFMHMGLCGQPEAACHAGGVLGGLAAFALIYICRRMPKHC